MNSLWLIIWRFQPLHLGHQLLIETSLTENSQTIILIGSSNKQDQNNPYTYTWRKDVIEKIYHQDFDIYDLPDFPNDTDWVNKVQSYIPKEIKKVTLYCGDIKNDSAVNSLIKSQETLPFDLDIKEIPRSIIPVSATQVREWIAEWNTEKLQKYLSKKTLLFLGIEL